MDSSEIFAINQFRKRLKWVDHRSDGLIALGLLGAALLLFCFQLGNLPLRDWDEGLIAQVAKEIWQSFDDAEQRTWLFPTLWGKPYFNKPPLIHILTAIAFSVGGVSEWTARLPSAILTACSVPLLYGVCREAFQQRLPAILSALVYLTMLPVVRHGRLAMLDGAVLCFFLLSIACLLRSRQNQRYALGVGIGLGLVCLTKGLMVGVLLGAIALIFLLINEQTHLLKSNFLWVGIFLGIAPVIAWYGLQNWRYGASFWQVHFLSQSFNRIWEPVERNTGPTWYYLVEVAKYAWPWLLFLPAGISLCWQHASMVWARLTLIWLLVYMLAISVMSTKLPWYVLPLYPVLAIAIGAQLAVLWRKSRHANTQEYAASSYSQRWVWSFALLSLLGLVGSVYFGFFAPQPEPDVRLMLAVFGLTMTAVTLLSAKRNPQFITVMIWGTYLTLLLLMGSEHWVWELAEAYPVKPVAAVIQQYAPPGDNVYTSFSVNRPALNFYSDRRIIPASRKELRQLWRQAEPPYFLLDTNVVKELALEDTQVLGEAEGFSLVTRVTKN